jgi:futalosine hydrolase
LIAVPSGFDAERISWIDDMKPEDHKDSFGRRVQVTQLLLIPTQFELNFFYEFWPESIERPVLPGLLKQPAANTGSDQLQVELCGFGLVVAAAQTARLLEQYSPKQVLLLGIAGGYCSPAEIGTAWVFSEVACYGVGVGTGSEFRSAGKMGWQQWSSTDPRFIIGDSLVLNSPASHQFRRRLLSVTSAAENSRDVMLRKAYDPQAIAEDMEGFAVAAACRLTQTPLTIIRGISNLAGDRDKVNWKVSEAMQAAVALAQPLIMAS